MCQKKSVGVDMQKLDNIAVLDVSPWACSRQCLGRNDLPEVVGVIVSVSSDLLPWTRSQSPEDGSDVSDRLTLRTDSTIIISERIVFLVRMQEDFCILMLHRNRVVVADICRCCLENAKVRIFRTHLAHSGAFHCPLKSPGRLDS